MNSWNDKSLLEVKAMRDSGLTYEQIGKSYGVTKQRAVSLVKRAEKVAEIQLGRTVRAVVRLIEEKTNNT